MRSPMHPVLRLCEDLLCNDAALELPALPRMIFVVHGSVTIESRELSDGEAWHGQGAVTVQAGKAGATCWRWDLMPAAAAPASSLPATTREKLSAPLATLPEGELLLRGDSV